MLSVGKKRMKKESFKEDSYPKHFLLKPFKTNHKNNSRIICDNQ
jgi:hypothetical protein